MEVSRGSPPFPESWGELHSNSTLGPTSGQYPGAAWGDVGPPLVLPLSQ